MKHDFPAVPNTNFLLQLVISERHSGITVIFVIDLNHIIYHSGWVEKHGGGDEREEGVG